jgi:hypothetical protein
MSSKPKYFGSILYILKIKKIPTLNTITKGTEVKYLPALISTPS